jgi:hypothetical protein
MVHESLLGKLLLFFPIELRQFTCQPRPFIAFTQNVHSGLKRTASVRILSFPHPAIQIRDGLAVERYSNFLHHTDSMTIPTTCGNNGASDGACG